MCQMGRWGSHSQQGVRGKKPTSSRSPEPTPSQGVVCPCPSCLWPPPRTRPSLPGCPQELPARPAPRRSIPPPSAHRRYLPGRRQHPVCGNLLGGSPGPWWGYAACVSPQQPSEAWLLPEELTVHRSPWATHGASTDLLGDPSDCERVSVGCSKPPSMRSLVTATLKRMPCLKPASLRLSPPGCGCARWHGLVRAGCGNGPTFLPSSAQTGHQARPTNQVWAGPAGGLHCRVKGGPGQATRQPPCPCTPEQVGRGYQGPRMGGGQRAGGA